MSARGFGRGIAAALVQAGAQGVARDHDRLAEVRAELGESFIPVTGETSGLNGEVDVRHVSQWVREAPLAPGSTVITMSGGAALAGDAGLDQAAYLLTAAGLRPAA